MRLWNIVLHLDANDDIKLLVTNHSGVRCCLPYTIHHYPSVLYGFRPDAVIRNNKTSQLKFKLQARGRTRMKNTNLKFSLEWKSRTVFFFQSSKEHPSVLSALSKKCENKSWPIASFFAFHVLISTIK